MPIIKYEPTFAELVDNAAKKRTEDIERWNQAIYNLYGNNVDPITIFINKIRGKEENNKENKQENNNKQENDKNEIEVKSSFILKVSSLAYLLINGPIVYPRCIIICFAILTLIFRLSDANLQQSTANFCTVLDIIINVFFILEGILRLFTLPATFQSRKLQSEQITSLTYEIIRCGWIEILISISSIFVLQTYDSLNAICWFNFFRLSFIANVFLAELPQVEVILSGIISGIRSVISTWFLLMLTFIIYGVLTTSYFRLNDPAHFSTVGTSMFTLFRISTMDSWSVIYQINAYGCDAVPSDYVVIPRNDTTPRYVDVTSGRMYLFLCDNPDAYPYASSFIFVSYVVLTGFILISLTVAAVSTGVKMRLTEIQKYTEERKLTEQQKLLQSNPLFIDRLLSESTENYDVIRKKSIFGSDESNPDLTDISIPSKLKPLILKQMSAAKTVKSLKSLTEVVPAPSVSEQGTKLTPSFRGIPLLENKELLRTICKQMWYDVDTIRQKRKEEKEIEKEMYPLGKISSRTQSSSTISNGTTSVNTSINDLTSKPSISRISRLTQKVQQISLVNIRKRATIRQSIVSFIPKLSQTGKKNSIRKILQAHQIEEIFSSYQNFLLFIRNCMASQIYIGYLIIIIILAASFQIYCVNKDNCENFWSAFLTIQILLTIDLIMRISTYYPSTTDYFLNKNNLFDIFIGFITWIPIFPTQIGTILGTARIVYLLRLFPLLSWITDLQVIFLAFNSSMRPLLYVVGIMFLMFFHFAVAGVLIFKRNDEFYFGSLYDAMNSLFQICTLDNWGDIALKNMYGCDLYGSDTDISSYNDLCERPYGLGWIAAWYFLIFITLSVMILHSLFVGIIISAMELLKDSVFREAKMWKIIYLRVDKYGLQNSTLMNLLEIYNALDSEKNGIVSKKELQPILNVLPKIQLDTVFKQISPEILGQLNFAEFIDLIHYIGVHGKVYRHGLLTKSASIKQLKNQIITEESEVLNEDKKLVPQSTNTPIKEYTNVEGF